MCLMCGKHSCKDCSHKGGWHGCNLSTLAKVLVIVGGLNWGLVGVGMLVGGMDVWNLVNMLVGQWPVVEAIVYVLVGIAAMSQIFGCKCNKCESVVCESCGVDNKCQCGGSCVNGKCDKCGNDCPSK